MNSTLDLGVTGTGEDTRQSAERILGTADYTTIRQAMLVSDTVMRGDGSKLTFRTERTRVCSRTVWSHSIADGIDKGHGNASCVVVYKKSRTVW